MNKNNKRKFWKERALQQWLDLTELFQKVKKTPSFKLFSKFLVQLFKIFANIIIRKIIEHIIKHFF